MIFRQSLSLTIEELKMILPLKPTTRNGDLIIFLEERKKLVLAFFGQITRLSPINPQSHLIQAHICFFGLPLKFRFLALKTEQITGQELFALNDRRCYLRAIDMAVVANEATSAEPFWEIGLEIENAEEIETNSSEDPDPRPPHKPTKTRPNLRLIK
ncbi:MAG: hypothetical protein LBT38_03620 [Deltaproteobacteria bacterium]|jgi:hypothetical protein|nr:hypothetical protein [Deltaproteobacteria bacterium]